MPRGPPVAKENDVHDRAYQPIEPATFLSSVSYLLLSGSTSMRGTGCKNGSRHTYTPASCESIIHGQRMDPYLTTSNPSSCDGHIRLNIRGLLSLKCVLSNIVRVSIRDTHLLVCSLDTTSNQSEPTACQTPDLQLGFS